MSFFLSRGRTYAEFFTPTLDSGIRLGITVKRHAEGLIVWTLGLFVLTITIGRYTKALPAE